MARLPASAHRFPKNAASQTKNTSRTVQINSRIIAQLTRRCLRMLSFNMRMERDARLQLTKISALMRRTKLM